MLFPILEEQPFAPLDRGRLQAVQEDKKPVAQTGLVAGADRQVAGVDNQVVGVDRQVVELDSQLVVEPDKQVVEPDKKVVEQDKQVVEEDRLQEDTGPWGMH